MSKKQKPPIDPVVLMMLGIVFIAVAIGLAVVPSGPNTVNIANDAATMSQLVVAFVTGLTTGGLSCLAVQGGLLASSLAHQIEQDYVGQASQNKSRNKGKIPAPARSSTALPIFLFLAAKLVAYTLLGALLGLLGSYLTFSPVTRALLMIAIGLCALVFATVEHRQNLQMLRAEYGAVRYSLATLVAGLIGLLGIAGLLTVLLRL